jgi:hypothetical protein
MTEKKYRLIVNLFILCVGISVGILIGNWYAKQKVEQLIQERYEEKQREFQSHLDSLRDDLRSIMDDSTRKVIYDREKEWLRNYIQYRLTD